MGFEQFWRRKFFIRSGSSSSKFKREACIKIPSPIRMISGQRPTKKVILKSLNEYPTFMVQQMLHKVAAWKQNWEPVSEL